MSDELQQAQDEQVRLPEGVEPGKVAAYPIDLETGRPLRLSDGARKQLADDFAANPEATQIIVQDGDRTVEIGCSDDGGYFLLAEDVTGLTPEGEAPAEATEESVTVIGSTPEGSGFPTGDAPTNTRQAPVDVEPLDGPVATSSASRISAPIGKRARRAAARERRRAGIQEERERKQAERAAAESEGESAAEEA